MKLLRYGEPLKEKPGLLHDDGSIRDPSQVVCDINGSMLGSGACLEPLARLNPDDLPVLEGTPRIGACMADLGKFICVGFNYSDHAAESGMAVPKEPVLFFKATSAICGPNDDIEVPRNSTATDWEGELGVVIGTHAKYVSESDAKNHVGGYAVVNDLSEREFQFQRSGQCVKGKSADTLGPICPWLVTRDDVLDPQSLEMYLEVNGKRYQDGSTSTMAFGVAKLVSYISQFMSLLPGDIISTVTPPGVGMGQKPTPVCLRPGDRMQLGISGLGIQKQRVIAG